MCIRDSNYLNQKVLIDYVLMVFQGKSLQHNPDPSWLSNRAWTEILSLENIPSLVELVGMFPSQVHKYKAIVDSSEPHR